MRLNLELAIVADGQSQREIPACCDVPANRLSSIIHGWTSPRKTERDAIAAALGKPADALFEAHADEPHDVEEPVR